MNYLDLIDYTNKFKNIYEQITNNENGTELMRKECFNSSLELVNALLKDFFGNNNNDVASLCVSFIEQINSLHILVNNSIMAALALLNCYEIFISCVYLLYKNKRYKEANRLICDKPICKDSFDGYLSVEKQEYFKLFNLNNVCPLLYSKLHNLDSVPVEQNLKLLFDRENQSLIGYSNFYFTETLITNVLALNDGYYRLSTRSYGLNDECISLKIKIKEDYERLKDLFGLDSLESVKIVLKENRSIFNYYNNCCLFDL